MSNLLNVKNLKVSVEDKEILKGIDLEVNKGEVHVIMGPNGSGKSTLLNTIMANPIYNINEGSIEFEGEDITETTADKRARAGIFMSFQSPEAINGVRLSDFLRQSKTAVSGEKQSILKFNKEVKNELKALKLSDDYADRYVNVGFSGGERKKSEMLQMKLLNPKLAMLDETDSGLDVDAVRIVSNAIDKFMNEEKAIIIITHHREILENIKADYVHIMKDGKLIMSGDNSLMDRIEKDGYEWIE